MEKIVEKILKDLNEELYDKFKQNFLRGGFFGDRWKPKKDGSASRLIKSGALRWSIKSKIEGDTIVFTSSKPYAVAHNEGVDKIVTVRSKKGKTFQRRMKLPQRKFIGKYTGMEKTVERIAKKAIEEALKQIADNFNKS